MWIKDLRPGILVRTTNDWLVEIPYNAPQKSFNNSIIPGVILLIIKVKSIPEIDKVKYYWLKRGKDEEILEVIFLHKGKLFIRVSSETEFEEMFALAK